MWGERRSTRPAGAPSGCFAGRSWDWTGRLRTAERCDALRRTSRCRHGNRLIGAVSTVKVDTLSSEITDVNNVLS
jgi:hypothetical protein